MLDFLVKLKNDNQDFDFLSFTSNDNGESLSITGEKYKDPGTPVGGSAIGPQYHIVLYKDHPTDKKRFCDVECFNGILADPWEYISGLIPVGFYGVIARTTTTSEPIIGRLVDTIKKVC